MKKIVLMASAVLFSAVAFGQKKELNEVEKQIRKGDLANAQNSLEAIRSTASTGEFAPRFYFLEGQLNFTKAKNNSNVLASLQKTADAFEKVRQLEGGSPKGKYTSEMQPVVQEALNKLSQEGQGLYNKKDFKNAGVAYELLYRLSPKDTIYLYYAAELAVEGKDYNQALVHYNKLKKMNYDGTEILYLAKEKQTGKEETFADKNQRDLMVKAGTHTAPRTEKTPSKRAGIVKNIAAIYVEQGKTDEALAAFDDARKMYPKDANIILQQASIYLQLDNKQKFKESMEDAVKVDPKNPELYYNIGFINMEQNDFEGARKMFKQALDLRPNYTDAALNYSTTYIKEGNALIEQMNALGNSKADQIKYDELKAKRDDFFKKSAEVLENHIKKNESATPVLEQLKSIYGALGDSANFQRIKKLLGE